MYTPIALKEKTTGYIPVKARMTEDEIRTADILDLPGLGEMKGTTGAMVEDVLDPYEVAKTIQEEIAKSGASLTLTYLRQKESWEIFYKEQYIIYHYFRDLSRRCTVGSSLSKT